MPTELINEKQMRVAGWLMRSLINCHNSPDQKITSDQILYKIRNNGLKMDGGQLREIIGHIRRNDLCAPGFILSDNSGYWYSEDVAEMEKVWDSELSRARNILQNFNPLRRRVKHLKNQKEAIL